ncbi:unnamed protein product [Lampetra planeri]
MSSLLSAIRLAVAGCPAVCGATSRPLGRAGFSGSPKNAGGAGGGGKPSEERAHAAAVAGGPRRPRDAAHAGCPVRHTPGAPSGTRRVPRQAHAGRRSRKAAPSGGMDVWPSGGMDVALEAAWTRLAPES